MQIFENVSMVRNALSKTSVTMESAAMENIPKRGRVSPCTNVEGYLTLASVVFYEGAAPICSSIFLWCYFFLPFVLYVKGQPRPKTTIFNIVMLVWCHQKLGDAHI